MRVRITVSIAAADWSYIPQQVVDVAGDTHTLTSIPVALAEAWLACGHAVRVADGTPLTRMQPQSEPLATTVASLGPQGDRAGEIVH